MLTRACGHQVSGLSSTPVSMLGCVALLAASAALAAWAPNSAWAQAPQGGPTARVERVLQTEDDWQIYVTYYPATSDKEILNKETPVVVLLHGDKENRLVWEGDKGLASALAQAGFAVITVDLRKHGQSTNVARTAGDSPAGGKNTEGTNLLADDYTNMVDYDLPAVKKFIFEQHQAKRLNMNKMGIVASETSAVVAACFAEADWRKDPYDDAAAPEMKTPRGQDVRALVFLSPPQKARGLPLTEALSAVRDPDWNIALLTLYGKLNKSDEKAISTHRRLFGSTKANKDRIYLHGYNVNLRGIDLLGKKELDAEGTIIEFFKLHLKDLKDGEWRDRQSRLLKK
jgi:pimeloyl-ACP methyl ester carboxylesterase